ncbi:MAG: hypothetical protein OEZ22_13290 [Spirochaetia bacterium]|nr:hypothetical protein [Spirochaetia bacterium]
MKKIIKLSLVLLAAFTLLFCKADEKEEDEIAAQETEIEMRLSGLGSLSGNVSNSNANVEVAYHPEYNTTTDANGEFTLNNMMPGEYTVYVTGTISGSLAKLSANNRLNAIDSNIVAGQFKNIIVSVEGPTILPKKSLTTPGSISGTVALLNNPNNVELVGIDVYVPGTSYIAKTDESGNFVLSNIPEGNYDLVRFDKSGLTSSEVINVDVATNQDTNIGTIYMALSTGPSGEITGIAGTTQAVIGAETFDILTSNNVELNLLYDTRATLMKAAHESSFLNREWEPVINTYTFNAATNAEAMNYFSTDGIKTVYVKFSDLNGLESSPVYKSFYIDTQPPQLSNIVILNSWAITGVQDIFIDIDALDNGTGIKEVLFCEDQAFTGCTAWQPYTSRVNFTLSAGVGAKTVYAKVRDYLNNESQVVSDSINLNTETLIHAQTYEEKITLYAAQSPYITDGTVIFNGGLEIEAGTQLIGSSITVKNEFKSLGTPGNEVIIEHPTNACTGPYLYLDQSTPGVSENFIMTNTILKSGRLYANGGHFSNNQFDSTACATPSGSIYKNGLDMLYLENNVYSNWSSAILVYEGNGNTIVSGNSGTVVNIIHQQATANNSVLTNNNFFCSSNNGGTFISVISGTLVHSGNTFTGDGTCIAFGTGTGSSGDVTSYSNYNITGCSKIAFIADNHDFTVTNSSLNCTMGIEMRKLNATNAARASISNSDITVSDKLIYSYGQTGYYGNTYDPLITFDSNNITCSNASGYCDLYYKIPYDYRDNHIENVVLSNNNIDCTGDATTGCRGFVVAKDAVLDSAPTILNFTITGNYWSGKTLPTDANLLANIITDTFANIGSVSHVNEIRLFHFSPDCLASIDGSGCPVGPPIDMDITWNFDAYSTIGSVITGIGFTP